MKNIIFFVLFSLFSYFSMAQSWSAYGGLPNSATRSSVIDASGNKWVAMFGGGISKFKPDETYDNYTSSNSGIPENFALCVTLDLLGNKWIGTNGSGAVVYNGTTWTTYNTSNGLPGNQINCITVDGSGNKWLGVNLNGATKYDGTTFTTYNTGNSSLPNNNVNCITIDASGNKWIGTYGGLAKFNGTTWTVYTTGTSGLAHDQVYSVTIENPTTIWIGTAGGLCKFDGTSTWTTYNTGNSGLPYNYVNCVAIDQNNIKWIGTTQGGMAKYNGTTWTVFNTSNSYIPAMNIKHITIDSDNNLWLCSNGGFAFYGIPPVVGPSTDAQLSALNVNGSLVTGFSPTTFNYNVVLPYGTSTLPVVTATTNHPLANLLITDATALPGFATAMVTAEDGTTILTYTINFTVAAPSSDATLSGLLVNGSLVSGFNSNVFSYNIIYPYGTTTLPVVTATTTHAGANKVITNIAVFPGTAMVVVTAQNGSTSLTYYINFSVVPASSVASLATLLVNGVSVAGFSSGTYIYNVVYPYGTTALPVVTATTTDASATKIITNITGYPGTATVVVTAQNGVTSLTYSIYFSVSPPSFVASLSSLLVDGVSVAGFSSSTYSYNVVLPYGTTVMPVVTATTTDASATKVITNITSLPNTATVVVTAQDGTTSLTYSINFSVAPNNDAKLSALYVDGILVNGFSPTVFDYNEILPYGTTSMPIVTADLNNVNANKVINNVSSLPGSASVIVTAEDGITESTYTINFTIALSINSVSVNTFEPYPSPTKGSITIPCENEGEMIVNDVTGRIILKSKISPDFKTFDIERNPKGVYFVQTIINGKSLNYKIVLE